ncbi:hypothetical protein VP01_276g9 [Puccinia sorghi]|uniref:Uncharacterized protein n=1 Tax=Puccinia sorghi TaxID=27349 RepID=A0A0L6V2U0_9BASI|nr:hypothetical protein VP01_276g9 [Puccinia sorghi]
MLYIYKILVLEANGHYDFMDVQKEINDNLKAQSEFYFHQGFLNEIDKLSQRIHVDKLGPCDIDHWMSMQTTVWKEKLSQ